MVILYKNGEFMLRFYIHENLKNNDIGQVTLLFLWSEYLDNLKLFEEKGKKFEIIFRNLG